jgi:hypothetical protein
MTSRFPQYLWGEAGDKGQRALQGIQDLVGAFANPGAGYIQMGFQPTIEGALVLSEHTDASATAAVSGAGYLSILTVPDNQLWHVHLVAAELISGTFTMNRINWRAPNGNEPAIYVDHASGRSLLVSGPLDFYAGPGSIFRVNVDTFSGAGYVAIDVLVDIYRLQPLPDLS